MEVQIPLDRMTTLDKLHAPEKIWDDLQQTPEDVPSPSWHGDVLQAREGRIKEGSSQFLDWSEAKSRLRDRTRRMGYMKELATEPPQYHPPEADKSPGATGQAQTGTGRHRR